MLTDTERTILTVFRARSTYTPGTYPQETMKALVNRGLLSCGANAYTQSKSYETTQAGVDAVVWELPEGWEWKRDEGGYYAYLREVGVHCIGREITISRIDKEDCSAPIDVVILVASRNEAA